MSSFHGDFAMTPEITDVLRYWRASLADGALGEGTFRNSDRKRFVELPGSALKSGTLPKSIVRRLFSGKEGGSVAVRFWPMVTARKTSHGAQRADGMPDLVAPVVTEGLVDRAGRLIPIRNAIARDLLSPLPYGCFSLGSVETLDEFLAATPLPEATPGNGWDDYLQHCRQMLDSLAPGWPAGDADYLPTGAGFIEVSEGADATVRGMLDLYDRLLAEQPHTPLLSQIVAPNLNDDVLDTSFENEFARRLGHSNSNFPLAEHQRQVLAWLDASRPGDVIAVNGPPGTGKTTMLLSAVASLWVKAALEGGDPPVIVASSSNNQAVTNIIDAFGKDFAPGEGVFAGRWLPDIDSFGMFLPSHSRRLEAARRYQTEAFQAECETVAYFEQAKVAWLEAARQAFPEQADATVSDLVTELQSLIVSEARKLTKLDDAKAAQVKARAAVTADLGADPLAEYGRRAEQLRSSRATAEDRDRDLKTFQQYLADESWLTSAFGFLGSVRKKRALRAKLALGETAGDLSALDRVEAIEAHVTKAAADARSVLCAAEQLLAKADALLKALKKTEVAWRSATEHFGGSDDPGALEKAADLGTRFQLFLLATHYWEGRWLLAMEQDLAAISSSQEKKGKKTVVPRWHRRMMLTPCAVVTFASLPGKLTCSRYEAGSFATDSLYNFIDLLIVDEAGQVLPEVAGAAFSLAKRALVIGDTQQIEPISSVPAPVDLGNLKDCGLISGEEDTEALTQSGIRTTDGSAMRLAQEACQIAPWPDLERGLYLFEHRRCRDDIIGFSNALCYKGKLRPMRGPAPKDALLPALGYLHVDGRSVAQGGSRSNIVEARTIAAWLESNRRDLEQEYGLPLEKIVGVVTPFGQQVRAIRAACADRDVNTDGAAGMTIGTVHALQGAERPVILFSPVYSKHADGGFIDASPSMLNVMASRAKDSCLVFGDMDVLASARSGSPRALLSEFLSAKGRALEFAVAPRDDLARADRKLEMLQDAAEHDAFLLDALRGEGRRYVIVSPWVVASTMDRTGILAAMKDARDRGAEIEVFADPLLNTRPAAEGLTQMETVARRLSSIGVAFHGVPKLHSKVVSVDSDLLCVGSFNWLSADRKGQYARHETSFLYRGQHLKTEIQTIRDALMSRSN